MTSPPPMPPTRHSARSGIGWLLQALAPAPRSPPLLLFPAQHRHPAAESFAASLIVGLWSLTASFLLCLPSDSLPAPLAFRCLIALSAWIVLIQLTVILPLLAYPLFRLARLSPQHLATLSELAFLLLLSLIAWHLTNSPSPLATFLGRFWLVLMMAEAALRLARAGIALASRPR
jgi:hypothetical protein